MEEIRDMFNFLKDVSSEMKKVTWPKGSELYSYTLTVVVTVVFVAVFLQSLILEFHRY